MPRPAFIARLRAPRPTPPRRTRWLLLPAVVAVIIGTWAVLDPSWAGAPALLALGWAGIALLGTQLWHWTAYPWIAGWSVFAPTNLLREQPGEHAYLWIGTLVALLCFVFALWRGAGADPDPNPEPGR